RKKTGIWPGSHILPDFRRLHSAEVRLCPEELAWSLSSTPRLLRVLHIAQELAFGIDHHYVALAGEGVFVSLHAAIELVEARILGIGISIDLGGNVIALTPCPLGLPE